MARPSALLLLPLVAALALPAIQATNSGKQHPPGAPGNASRRDDRGGAPASKPACGRSDAFKFDAADTGVTPAAGLSNTSYNADDVRQHIASQGPLPLVPDTATTFACVDSRTEHGVLATPGGDLAEVLGAVTVYQNLTGGAKDQKALDSLVAELAGSDVFGPGRPLYYHTDNGKLQSVFKAVHAAGVEPTPVAFPLEAPANQTERDIWLSQLTSGPLQGCGHFRLLITRYADYGYPSPSLPQAVVRAFYNYWWPTPVGSPQRARVEFSVVQGPLEGRAVSIITSDGCPGHSPAVAPSHGGSQVFVYHPTAIEAFREQALAPWFANYARKQGAQVDEAKFKSQLKSLQARHLAGTLAYLPPANALRQVSVKFQA